MAATWAVRTDAFLAQLKGWGKESGLFSCLSLLTAAVLLADLQLSKDKITPRYESSLPWYHSTYQNILNQQNIHLKGWPPWLLEACTSKKTVFFGSRYQGSENIGIPKYWSGIQVQLFSRILILFSSIIPYCNLSGGAFFSKWHKNCSRHTSACPFIPKFPANWSKKSHSITPDYHAPSHTPLFPIGEGNAMFLPSQRIVKDTIANRASTGQKPLKAGRTNKPSPQKMQNQGIPADVWENVASLSQYTKNPRIKNPTQCETRESSKPNRIEILLQTQQIQN